ncbi:hypothetical protein AW729_10450 [Methanosphaera sp. BMS]|nr:hypothetical protein AW729_10450 [Methanosphaera sp. BMS]
MYLAGFQTPVFSTIAAFKRDHQDLIEKVFLETINYGHNKYLIDLDSISVDGSKTRAYANKYNNLTNEDVLKLLHIIRKGIITDVEENKALENRQNKTIKNEEDKKEQIKEALKESRNIKVKQDEKPQTVKKIIPEEKDEKQKLLDDFRSKPMKNSMKHDESKFDEELYELIDDNDLNFCGKQILKQAIEHPETAYKQVRKLEKCKEELEKSGKNTVNYTDPEARKSPNKEQVMQTGYNEQIVVDNKNGIIIAVDVTQDANDQNQLLPMIEQTQNNLQEALNITTEETEQLIHNMDILADNGYYKDEIVHKNYEEEHYNILMPNRQQASKQKDCLRRKSQRKQNHNKKDGFSKHNMIKDEENYCYICPENKILPVQQVYPGKYNDRIIYYTSECSKCPSKDICLTNKMTGKVITDYTSEAKELLAYNFETPAGEKQYSKRMPMVEPRFAYNKYTLKYRQYHLIGLNNAKMQQTLMATAQNIVKIHNIELKEQQNNKTIIDLT